MKDVFARLTIGRALALGIGLAVLYYFTMFDSGSGQLSRITAAKAQSADMKNKIHEDQVKLDRAAVYQKTAAETGSTINRLLGAIPENFDIPDLMKLVSNETKVAGTSLLNILPGATEISPVAKEFEELSVSVDMNGSFLQQMVFLANITKINQILIIRKFDLSIAHEPKADEPPSVHMTAEIVAYRYRGQAANAAAGAQPGQKGTESK